MVFSLPAQLVKLPYSDEPTAATGMSLPTKLSFSQIFFRRDKALFFLFLFFFFFGDFFFFVPVGSLGVAAYSGTQSVV